jgi:hypothetical protein
MESAETVQRQTEGGEADSEHRRPALTGRGDEQPPRCKASAPTPTHKGEHMTHKRQHRWHIEVISPPDLTSAMRDIRKSYRRLRTVGLPAYEARYIVLNLLISGSCVDVRAEKIS